MVDIAEVNALPSNCFMILTIVLVEQAEGYWCSNFVSEMHGGIVEVGPGVRISLISLNLASSALTGRGKIKLIHKFQDKDRIQQLRTI